MSVDINDKSIMMQGLNESREGLRKRSFSKSIRTTNNEIKLNSKLDSPKKMNKSF
jgi:hypothetical protein